MALTVVIANDGFRLEEGRLQLELTARDGSWLQRNLTTLLRAARHFVMEETRAARYLANYRQETMPLIALRNAKHLLQEESGSPEAREITGLLLEDAQRYYSLVSPGVEKGPESVDSDRLVVPTGDPWQFAASLGVIRRVSTSELELGLPATEPTAP